MDNKLIVRKLKVGGNEITVLQLSGNITLASLFDLQRTVREDIASTLVLDMTEVAIVDSAGIGLLVNAHVSRANSGRRLLLVGVVERIKSILTVTGVYNIFSIFSTLDEAMQSFRQPANS